MYRLSFAINGVDRKSNYRVFLNRAHPNVQAFIVITHGQRVGWRFQQEPVQLQFFSSSSVALEKCLKHVFLDWIGLTQDYTGPLKRKGKRLKRWKGRGLLRGRALSERAHAFPKGSDRVRATKTVVNRQRVFCCISTPACQTTPSITPCQIIEMHRMPRSIKDFGPAKTNPG